MSHTKGRLRQDVHPRGGRYHTLAMEFPCINGLPAWFVVARVDVPATPEVNMTDGQFSPEFAEHMARRIVALWNAAEELGLTTEAIEAGAIQRAFAVQRTAASRRELRTPNEDHQRCMHCGDYADECMCDGGRS